MASLHGQDIPVNLVLWFLWYYKARFQERRMSLLCFRLKACYKLIFSGSYFVMKNCPACVNKFILWKMFSKSVQCVRQSTHFPYLNIMIFKLDVFLSLAKHRLCYWHNRRTYRLLTDILIMTYFVVNFRVSVASILFEGYNSFKNIHSYSVFFSSTKFSNCTRHAFPLIVQV